MKNVTPMIYMIILFMTSACSPRVVTNTSITLPPTALSSQVAVYDWNDSIPNNTITIGNVAVRDGGLTIKCGYDRVLDLAKSATAEAGGNILYLTHHEYPNFWASTCHQISGMMLYANDSLYTKNQEYNGNYTSVLPRKSAFTVAPSNIFSFNAGYGWITSKIYDINMNLIDQNIGGIDLELQYEHVFKGGWSLGLQAAQFKSNNIPDACITLTFIALQAGCSLRLNSWIFKGDLALGYVHYDDNWITKNGAYTNIALGVDYMILPFLGIGARISLPTANFRNENANLRNEREGIHRLNLSGGIRFYL